MTAAGNSETESCEDTVMNQINCVELDGRYVARLNDRNAVLAEGVSRAECISNAKLALVNAKKIAEHYRTQTKA